MILSRQLRFECQLGVSDLDWKALFVEQIFHKSLNLPSLD